MASRRQIRLRREYLYRKSLEGGEREEAEKKERIRRALRDGKPVPTELRDFAASVREEMDAEDVATRELRRAVDDEYALAGKADPRVCVTTSRDPSSRLKQFAKEVRLLFPGAVTLNRGGTTTGELVEAVRGSGFSDLVVVHETRGEPDALIVSHFPYGPTLWCTLSSSVLRHDIDGVAPASEAFPHLIFDGFDSSIGHRVVTILKHLFPVPKADSKRVLTFANRDDTISFRHHTFKKVPKTKTPSKKDDDDEDDDDEGEEGEGGGGEGMGMGPTHLDVHLEEIGPRFELTPFQIKLGTLEQTEAETEWVLRPYMRTAAKRKAL